MGSNTIFKNGDIMTPTTNLLYFLWN